MRRINHSSRFIEITKSERTHLHVLNKLTSIERKNVNPIRGTIYTLYSFPAYDNNRIPEVVDGGDIKSSKLLLTSNTVLYNKLNVRLRRVWNIKELKTNNNICSSEFIPLKVNKDVILQEYLMYCLTSDTVTELMESASQGTSNSQQRISPLSLMQVSIPVIPKNEQKHFIELYQQSDKSKFSDFKSRFIEMFGGNKYPNIRLGEFTDLTWGDTNTTKNSYVADGYLAFSASGPDGKLDHYDYDREGIVLSAIGADCGKTWFAEGKWSCIKNTIRFWSISEVLDNHYLFLATRDKEYWPRKGGAQPFIPQGEARDCVIPLPPLDLQLVFVELANQADKSKYLN